MKTIQVFLGGGVKLLHGENEILKGYRNDVVDPIISQLNSTEYAKHLFIVKDYSDLTRNVVKGEHQTVYNNYIVREAQISLFIIDGEIGNITKHEIDIAVVSAKKVGHPIVYVYGKNLKADDEILVYLNQEDIYFQHFFDHRDLSAKIKADLETATQRLDRRRTFRLGMSLFLFVVFFCSIILLLKNHTDSGENTIDYCSAQLYLMRYQDVNVMTESTIFSNNLLSNFKYEDSVMAEGDISVFPIIGNDSIVTSTPPFFRIKLHNRHRNTIVFVEAKLEIDEYVIDTNAQLQSIIPIKEIPYAEIVNIDSKNHEYSLKRFRQNVAYGETDDRYFFALFANESCSFRMRVRAKSQLGDYLYSNYICVRYIK